LKAVVISGYLFNLSDNIIPFIKDNDVFVHTWRDRDNGRWITKLNRYRKYCNNLKVLVEDPKFNKKLFSYFYSTYTAVNMIEDLDKYDTIIKFKPNLDSISVSYRGWLQEYFKKASVQCRPMLTDTAKEECIYGSIYYKTLDERLFSGYPLVFRKSFLILYKQFEEEMFSLDNELSLKYGSDYEGSIFWTEWFKRRDIKLIQDLHLRIPNNIQDGRYY
jgi:hypothetical protein